MLLKNVHNNHSHEPASEELPHKDFTTLITCFKIFAWSLVPSGAAYFITGDLKIAGSICGVVAVLLTLYHTAFGIFILCSLLSIENAIVFREDFTISKLMGIVILVSFLFHMRHLKLVYPTAQKLMFLFALWSCAGLLWSLDTEITITSLTTFILYIGICFIFLSTVQDQKSLFFVISGFTLGALITSGMLMVGKVTYSTYSNVLMGRATLAKGTNPVILARSISFGALTACHIFFQQGKIRKIITVGLLVLFCFANAAKTQSRMALAVTLGIPVLSLLLSSESKNRMKNFFLVLLIGSISFYTVNLILESGLMSKMAKQRFESQGLEESGRLELWSQGFYAFLKRPIHGYGIDNSPLALERRLKGTAVHNNFIGIAVDLGLVGLTLAMAIFNVLYKQLRNIADKGLKWLGMAMLLYALLSGMTAVNYTKKDFWYALTIAMVAVNIDRIKKEEVPL